MALKLLQQPNGISAENDKCYMKTFRFIPPNFSCSVFRTSNRCHSLRLQNVKADTINDQILDIQLI